MDTQTQNINTARTDARLINLESDVWHLEDFAARLVEVTEDDVWDFSIEWDDVANAKLPSLLADADADRLSAAQLDRLDGLLSRLRDVASTLDHFDLAIPARMERETRQLAAA